MRKLIANFAKSFGGINFNTTTLIKLLLIYLIFVFVFGQRGLLHLYAYSDRLENLQTEIEELKINLEELQELSKYNQDQIKTEYHARDQLGLIKPNERVLFINKKSE